MERTAVEMCNNCLAEHADRSKRFWQCFQRRLRRITCYALSWKGIQSS